jgi:hypothetical protein
MKPFKYGVLIASLAFVTVAPARAQQPAPSGSNSGTDAAEGAVEAALIAAAVKIMQENVKASGRESGEIDKLIRALSGISVKDIKEYGICGGPNSEARKIAGSLCNKIN